MFYLYENNLLPIMQISHHGADFAIIVSGEPLTREGETNEMPIICTYEDIYRQKLH